MQIFRLSMLTLTCSVALSACGGGGSGTPTVQSTSNVQAQTSQATPSNPASNNPANGSNSASNNPANGSNSASNNPTNNDTATTFSTALSKTFAVGGGSKGDNWMNTGYGTYNGAAISINNNTGTVKGAHTASDQDFESFTLNGNRVLLLAGASDKLNAPIHIRVLKESDFTQVGSAFHPKDPTNPGWVGSLATGRGFGAFSNVKFGVYTDADNVSHLFVHGKPASFMYNTGKYEYLGSAVFGKDGNYQGLANSITAIADFDKRTVDVALKLSDGKQLDFGGNITGNVFEGTKNNIETRGGFFGYNDMGGIYHVKEGEFKGYNGAYGATETRKIVE